MFDGLPEFDHVFAQGLGLGIHEGFVELGAQRRVGTQVVEDHHLVDVGLVLARPTFGPGHQLADDHVLGAGTPHLKRLDAGHFNHLSQPAAERLAIARCHRQWQQVGLFPPAGVDDVEILDPDIDIYEKDREINRMEWEVRRKALEHLVVVNTKGDVPAVLILTSAVIDIERIGDYSKNIFELGDICPDTKVIEDDHASFFEEIESQILTIFDLTRSAYKEANIQKAQTAMEMHWQISERCDKMFEELASEKDLSPEHAVIYTLLARYLKRVSSHLKNIASSVVNPFPRMGFRASEGGKEPDIG